MMLVREEHPLKADAPMVSTLEGILMLLSSVQPQKVSTPMLLRLLPWMVTLRSSVQFWKAPVL